MEQLVDPKIAFKHTHTTPYHPQANSAVEIINKTVQKYLASFVDATTLDWPLLIAPMQFSYNTSINSSTKVSPMNSFLTIVLLTGLGPSAKMRATKC